MTRTIVHWAVAALIWFAAQAAEAGVAFRVTKVRGTVKMLPPWSASWVDVRKGDHLSYGSLLQVFEGGRVGLVTKASTGEKGALAVPRELAFSNSTLIRLDGGLFRDAEPKRLYFDSARRLASMESESGGETQLQDAWRRFAAYLPEDLPIFGTTPENGDLTLTNKRVRKVHLLRPVQAHDITPLVLPVSFRVVWREVAGKDLAFEVAAWRTEDLEPTVVGTTKGTSFLTKFDDYGSYFVKVRSADGAYESETHRVFVKPPMSRDAMTRLKRRYDLKPGQPEILVRSPPRDLRVTAADGPKRIDFHWLLGVDVVADIRYRLTVRSRERVVSRFETTAPAASLSLPPGSYEWSIEPIENMDKTGSLQAWLPGSAKGRIEIASGGKKALEDLSEHIRQGQSLRTIYLSDGL